MPNLFEISKEYSAIQNIEDMPEEAIRDTLEAIEGEFQDKAAAIIKVTLNMGSDIDQIDAEIKRLNGIKEARKNHITRLRDYLKKNMDACGISKIEHPLFNISLSKASEKVRITDESALPDDYVIVKTVITPDKSKILKGLKDGEDIPGAELEDAERRLTIK